MNKKILSLLILLIITPCLMAQKKELSQARSDIKNNRNLAQTEKLLSELSADRKKSAGIHQRNDDRTGQCPHQRLGLYTDGTARDSFPHLCEDRTGRNEPR